MMKRIVLGAMASVFSIQLWAFDVAAVWGTPDFSKEYVSATVTEHVDLLDFEGESARTTEWARALVLSGAKEIFSVNVTPWNGRVEADTFYEGLNLAAHHSGVVLTNIGPIMAGNDVCDLINAFNEHVVFVVRYTGAHPTCFAANLLEVYNMGRYDEDRPAHVAAQLANFSVIYPDLKGAELLNRFRIETAR